MNRELETAIKARDTAYFLVQELQELRSLARKHNPASRHPTIPLSFLRDALRIGYGLDKLVEDLKKEEYNG